MDKPNEYVYVVYYDGNIENETLGIFTTREKVKEMLEFIDKTSDKISKRTYVVQHRIDPEFNDRMTAFLKGVEYYNR